MKIIFSSEPEGNISYYPFFEENDVIKKHYPEGLYKRVTKDKKLLSAKDSSRRYAIDGMEMHAVSLGKKTDINAETIRRFASIVCASAKKENYGTINIYLMPVTAGIEPQDLAAAVFEGLLLEEYRYAGFKSKKTGTARIEKAVIVCGLKIKNINSIEKKARIYCESVFMTRDLVNGPANIVTIDHIEKYAKDLARRNGLSIKIFKKSDLAKMGMNLILGVGAGAGSPPRLIELKYSCGSKAKTVCLVGKGIVFDSGGLNIKTGNFMDDMKSDMSGAATVLGILYGASKLKLKVNLLAYLPLAENSVDGNSYRPGDVIRSYNKKTVEIKNTDAEGRLILADALAYSDTKKPDITLDFATLTGAAVVGLGTRITAAFFRDKITAEDIMRSSENTGEPIWELPLFDGYKEYLKNDIADLSNIGNPPREAGTIVAALFLSEFVYNPNWAHFDIAGPAYLEKGYYYNQKGGTGVMVRTILDYLSHLKAKN